MRRKINFTERKKINRSEIEIGIINDEDGRMVTIEMIKIDIKKYNFPSDARIFLEAFHNNSYIRFDYGSIGSITSPKQLTEIGLNDFVGSIASFRFKVVDNNNYPGRIIGVADKIRPKLKGGSILPVEFIDLGNKVWELHIDETDTFPVLRVNSNIDNIQDSVKSGGQFQALVFPAVIELILNKILVQGEFEKDDSQSDSPWRSEWIEFCENYADDKLPKRGRKDDDYYNKECERWISKVIESFCEEKAYVSKYSKELDYKHEN